ncbi:FAD-binding oxidoreductase [Halomonas sp. H2]|uniref:FAD-binding oxidoreductase n=1 Tax=Halomonas sp. H2 TaxID=261936 RepID=UPI003CF01AD7
MTDQYNFDAEICDIVGSERYLQDPDDMRGYLESWGGRYHGQARGVVLPKSTSEVADIMYLCRRLRIAIVPQSGNTGLVGGAVPMDGEGAIVLNLSRMNRIRAVDPINDTVTAEAGVILHALQTELANRDRCFPINLGSAGSCQIGGLIATNAGGTGAIRHGVMRDQILGLEVVLPDGQIFHGLRGLHKDNSGYDLKHLFIGAEGTLGIVTAAVLRLSAVPVQSITAMVSFSSLDAALRLLQKLRGGLGTRIESFELMSRRQLEIVLQHSDDSTSPVDPDGADWFGMIEIADTMADAKLSDGLVAILADMLESGDLRDATLANSLAQSQRIWRLRHSISEANRKIGFTVSHDTSVPISATASFLPRVEAALHAACPGVIVASCGHIGDGNVHVACVFPKDQFGGQDTEQLAWDMARIVQLESLACGGSIAAEHGIGRAHVVRLADSKDPTAYGLMRAIKACIDPYNIMNPGVMFTQRKDL